MKDGEERYNIRVRLAPQDRDSIARIRALRVSNGAGLSVALGDLADVRWEPGPAQIEREQGKRVIKVQANVRARPLASFVTDAQQAVAAQVRLPPGYTISWGGSFQDLQEGMARLSTVVPVALAVIFLLLYLMFGSARLATLIFFNVPFAAVGGIFALALRGMPFSISAAVGFIALFGIAILNGVVMVSYMEERRKEGLATADAAWQAAMTRLRPVLMTATVASLGFLPMALSTNSGAEVQRPLATVVIGGLISATLLTLLVLPALYSWFCRARRRSRGRTRCLLRAAACRVNLQPIETRHAMKKFSDLTEREVLAVAIASEEEDGRIYMSFAENLAERYPDLAKIFEQMAGEEKAPSPHAARAIRAAISGPICRRFGGRTSKDSCVGARLG